MTTVRELISELQKLPMDLPVHVWTSEEEFSDVLIDQRFADRWTPIDRITLEGWQ